MGQTAGGLLNATFGNAVEMLVTVHLWGRLGGQLLCGLRDPLGIMAGLPVERPFRKPTHPFPVFVFWSPPAAPLECCPCLLRGFPPGGARKQFATQNSGFPSSVFVFLARDVFFLDRPALAERRSVKHSCWAQLHMFGETP